MKRKLIFPIIIGLLFVTLVTAVTLGNFLTNTEIKPEYFDELELKYGTSDLSVNKSDCVPFSTTHCVFSVSGVGLHSSGNSLAMYHCDEHDEETGECLSKVAYTNQELSEQIDDFILGRRTQDAIASKDRRLASEMVVKETGGVNTLSKEKK